MFGFLFCFNSGEFLEDKILVPLPKNIFFVCFFNKGLLDGAVGVALFY